MMDDRMHRALDGELPADGLTPAERAELLRYRAMIGTTLEPLRRLPAIDNLHEARHDQPPPIQSQRL